MSYPEIFEIGMKKNKIHPQTGFLKRNPPNRNGGVFMFIE
jgi:hypothetical protein